MRLTPQQIEEIKRAVKEGKTKKEVAKQFGVSVNTVYYYTTPNFKNRVIKWLSTKLETNKNRTLLPNQKVKCIYCGYMWKPKVNHIPISCAKCNRLLLKYQIIEEVY